MGSPKALLRFQDETFLDRLIRIFSPVCDPIIVVVGQHGDQIRSGIERGREVLFAENPDPERGMLSSLQCGLALVPPQRGGCDVPAGGSSEYRRLRRSKRWPPGFRAIARR